MQRYKSVHTGAQIDSAAERALAGGAIDSALEDKQYLEFLDNVDFADPIAQAGVGGNHGSVAYALDRWKLISGTVSASSNGLTLNGTIRQIREKSIGFAVIPSIEMYSGTATITYDDTTKYCDITSSGGVIKRSHLGLTAITDWSKMPTLDYDKMSQKLRRFAYFLETNTYLRAILYSTNSIYFWLPLQVSMRTTPSMHFGLESTDWKISTLGDSGQPGFSLSIASGNASGILIAANKTAHGLTDASLRTMTANNGFIADL